MLARRLIEAARKIFRTHARQHSVALSEYDTTSFPLDLSLSSRSRSATTVELVTVHVTDVTGGFGVAKSAVARWRKLLEHDDVPRELVRQLPAPHDLGGSSFTLALLERYARCPYHWIGSRRAGVVRNHTAELRTSHGAGGNRGLGWALDAGHDEALSDELVAAGFRSLVQCISEAHEGSGSVIDVVPHRVFSASRRVDPGAAVWRTIVLSAVDALGPSVCQVNYDLVEARGRPVPWTWDSHALFDERGQRL